MRWLMTIGVLLILIGGGGGIAACFATSTFDRSDNETAAQLDGPTDALANNSDDATPSLWLMPLAGLTFAVGIVCIAIGMGDWRRPVPSAMRPANSRSNRPTEHGQPPRGVA
jgi:hypothetical protein